MLKAVGEEDQNDETILNFEDPFSTKKKRKHRPRVFDIVPLNDELEMLEIRVNELASVVDVFFILEAEYTFSGKPKPLYFSDHETRFRQFRDKIIHVIIPRLIIPDEEAQYAHYGVWANEKIARNKGLKIATDSRKPNDGDWIILSDLDKIPRKSFIETIQAPDPDTKIGRRLLEGFPESDGDVFKLGCSWSFSNITQAVRKMQSYSHREHNTNTFRKKEWLLNHYSQGIDLFERGGENYDYIENNQDLPQYILENPGRFSYTLRRKGLANAGFTDVDLTSPLAED
ncbi:hypothetical protein EC968_010480 [Mortierella alpina]|nr:hypothetical protein EC968_010480 [Mortierella alpina]